MPVTIINNEIARYRKKQEKVIISYKNFKAKVQKG